MADVFLEPFAGAANDPPPNAIKLEGGALVWELTGGGRCRVDDPGPTAKVFYRYSDFVGRADFGASLKAQFSNPSTSGRGIQLCFDVIDADNYLWVEFRSGGGGAPWDAIGKPEVAFGKTVGGVETMLEGPTSVNGALALTAAQLYEVEVVRIYDPSTDTVDYEIRFEDSWLDSPRPLALITHNDGGVLTHRNERLGWRNTIPCDGAELEIDDLRAFELVDAAADAGDDYLTIGGTTFTPAEQVTEKISVLELGNSYAGGQDLSIEERVNWENRSFSPEQFVVLKADGAIRFRGYIHKRETVGTPGNETVLYRCVGRRTRIRYVTPTHPSTLSHRIIWNGELEDYLNGADALIFGGAGTKKTYGEALAWYFETFADDLRQVGAAKPQNVDAFVQADLDLLTMTPLRTELSGDFPAHVEGLLSQLRAWALLHNAETDLWRVFKVSGLASVGLDETNDRLIQSTISEDSTGLRTKVCIGSVRREAIDDVAKLSDAKLSGDWDAAHEAVWTPDKAKRESINATITAVNLGAGPLGEDEIDVDYDNPPTTFSAEWLDGQLVVTSGAASGEIHGMLLQSAAAHSGTIRLDGTFVGLPIVTDTIRLEGTGEPGGLNRFANVFRRYAISDALKGEILKKEDGGCPTLKMVVPEISAGELGTAGKTQEVLPVTPGEIGSYWTPIPITNPHSNAGASGSCVDDGGFESPEDLILEYAYVETTVLQVCKPTTGYVDPGYPDPVERPLMIEEPEWRDASQTAIVAERAQEILDVVSQRQFTGKPTLDGLHWAFAQLGVSMDLTSGSRTMPTDGVYVLPLGVRYVWPKKSTGIRTILDLGGTASFVESGADFRKKLTEKTVFERLKDAERRLRDLSACAGGDQTAEASDPNPLSRLCAAGINSGFSTIKPPTRPPPGPGIPLDELLDPLLLDLWQHDNSIEGILHNLGKTTDDESGEVLEPGTVNGGGDATYYAPDGSETTIPNGGTVPLTVNDLSENTIDGILANLGKTIDDVTGEVLAPGDIVGAGGATTFGPGGTSAVGPGGTVPPTTIGGLLENAGKTVSGSGEVLEGGGTVPVSPGPPYGTYYPPNYGGPIPLAPGATVPTPTGPAILTNLHKTNDDILGIVAPGTAIGADGGTTFTHADADGSVKMIAQAAGNTVPAAMHQMHEAIAARFGLSISTEEDPAGVVWTGA